MLGSKSFILLGITFLLSITLSAQTDSEQNYYRFFEVDTKGINQEEKSSLELHFSNHAHFRIESFCDQDEKILISINANYPSRVPDIIEELRLEFQSQIPNRKISKVDPISIEQKINFCQ